MFKNATTFAYVIISALSLALFLPFLGSVHLFDWDEINFAECAREMMVTGNYTNLQMNFFPFWEKPPLFIWMQVLSMKLFGINEFAARFPNAICGVVTLLFIFYAGKKMHSAQTAWIWVFLYLGSFLPQFYFHTGIIDPWFNLFIFSAFFYFVQYLQSSEKFLSYLFIASICGGLAILTKGPAAVIILGLCILILQIKNKTKPLLSLSHFLIVLTVTAMVGGLWFIVLVVRGQYAILAEFVSYQYHLFHAEDSGHGGPWFYHPLVLLIGCFPASVFALKKLGKSGAEDVKENYWHFSMRTLFWVVLILFSVVQTKIVHYSSLCYFPLTYLAATQIQEWTISKKRLPGLQFGLLVFVATVFLLAFFALPLAGTYKQVLIDANLIRDAFAIENLKAEITWSLFDYSPALAMLLVLTAVIALKSGITYKKLVFLVCSMLLGIELAIVLLVPKIEAYSQKVVIDFYVSLQEKDCYATSLNYRSYAPPFYAQKRAPEHLGPREVTPWLLHGPIDKDAYFVSKVTDVENYSSLYPQLIELKRSNGFVFYCRKVIK
jgi:4-amino-4-deoxy-L-arabinose transferase-like glycosyltransferase